MDFIFKDDPSELKQESLTVLKLLIHVLSCYLKSNVETIELKRGSNSVYVQYDDIMFFESSTKSQINRTLR